MNALELCSQIKHSAKAVPRLGVKKYNWWNEGLHGVARAGVATVFPQAIAMASTFDEAAIFNVASIISNEARAKYNHSRSRGDYGRYKGLTMWSPNINIFRDPRWGRGQETYGEDPYLTGVLAAAFIKGLQGDDKRYLKTSACAKHFAVHSGPEAKRHEFNAEVSKKDLFETYLPAFEKAVVEAKVSGVMGAYNRTNGEPCCASTSLMQKVLRESWGFDGYFVSDCGALLDFIFHHKITRNPLKAAALALNAGCDLECGALYGLAPLLLAFGLVKKSKLRESVARLMSIRSRLGMFDGDCPYDKIDISQNATAENEEYAVEVARKSVVLLENDGILPLKKNAQKIFVTGYNAENELAYLGSYNGEPTSYIKIPEAVKKYNEDAEFAPGVHLFDKEEGDGFAEALKKAGESDVIIMCSGLDPSVEGEEGGGKLAGAGGERGVQGDRTTLRLPRVQREYIDELLKLGKKLIILNFSGGCVDFRDYKNKANAILQCWYPGAKGGKAAADVLFGAASPSGKLPVTFYNSEDDLPDFEDYSMRNRTYRYFKGGVQYPFGYGLTYTSFVLEAFSYDEEENKAKATVKNAGSFDCDEVLQLYVSYPEADYETPLKALIRVERIGLKAGERAEVGFKLSEKDFYTIDDEGNAEFLKGAYKLFLSDGQNLNSPPIEIVNKKDSKIVKKCIL